MSNESKNSVSYGRQPWLGKNTVIALAKQGVDSIFTFRNNSEEANTVIRDVEALGQRAVALPLDVSKAQGFAQFAEVVVKAALLQHWKKAHSIILLIIK